MGCSGHPFADRLKRSDSGEGIESDLECLKVSELYREGDTHIRGRRRGENKDRCICEHHRLWAETVAPACAKIALEGGLAVKTDSARFGSLEESRKTFSARRKLAGP